LGGKIRLVEFSKKRPTNFEGTLRIDLVPPGDPLSGNTFELNIEKSFTELLPE
jgi:hypothetical protein